MAYTDRNAAPGRASRGLLLFCRWQLDETHPPIRHMIHYNAEGSLFMEKKPVPGVSSDAVTNVFKNGRMPTKEEYTNIWIELINRIERGKVEPI